MKFMTTLFAALEAADIGAMEGHEITEWNWQSTEYKLETPTNDEVSEATFHDQQVVINEDGCFMAIDADGATLRLSLRSSRPIQQGDIK